MTIMEMLKTKYLNQFGASDNDLELDYLLCNVNLLMEFSDELHRDEMELNVLLFLSTFKNHLLFLKESLSNKNDLGLLYKNLNSNAELILIQVKAKSANLYRCQPKKDNSDLRIGLIYQEIANMYLAIESLIQVFLIEKCYWYDKYGYRMDNIWPIELKKNFNELFGNINIVAESGNLEFVSVLLEK